MRMPPTAVLDSAAVRSQLPAARTATHLDIGTIAPLPGLTRDVMVETLDAELGDRRVTRERYLQFREYAAALRGDLGRVVGADPEEMALSSSTTDGINMALWGLDWKPGDVAVTTNLEHPGVLIPLYNLHQRYGVRIKFADAASGDPDRVLAAMAEAIRPGVKLVVFSHVTYETGAVLPVRELTELAHEAGAMVLVDGAQSVGAMPLDFHALGIDCYAFSGHKWLCGPEGMGGLYVNAAAMKLLRPAYLAEGDQWEHGDPDSLELSQEASQYEMGAFSRPAIRGFGASVSWLSATLGLDAIYQRTRELRDYCVDRVSQLAGAELLAPPEHLAGMVAFRLAGLEPTSCVKYLAAHRVFIRAIPSDGALRISCAFFTTEEAIERAIGLISAHRRGS
jgi:L-cysteine/cystine lyase